MHICLAQQNAALSRLRVASAARLYTRNAALTPTSTNTSGALPFGSALMCNPRPPEQILRSSNLVFSVLVNPLVASCRFAFLTPQLHTLYLSHVRSLSYLPFSLSFSIWSYCILFLPLRTLYILFYYRSTFFLLRLPSMDKTNRLLFCSVFLFALSSLEIAYGPPFFHRSSSSPIYRIAVVRCTNLHKTWTVAVLPNPPVQV